MAIMLFGVLVGPFARTNPSYWEQKQIRLK
jgi:hypothetical protein